MDTVVNPDNKLVPVTISAGITNNPDTKISIGETTDNKTPLYWNKDDSFDFNLNGTTYKFTVSEIKDDQRRAEFSCNAAPAEIAPGTYTATYPSGRKALPYYQKGTEAELDKYLYMTSIFDVKEGDTWEDISPEFKSEVAIVKLTLTHKDFAGQSLYGGKKVVYDVTLNNNGEKVAYSDTRFNSDDNGTIVVYFAVAGGTSFSNTTISAVCNSRNYTASLNSSNTLKAGKIYNVTKNMATIVPSIETIKISNITSTSAMSGGTITDEGQSAIIEKGIVWGTEYNPTIESSNKIVAGEGTDAFTSTLSSLTPYTSYYVRAYAKNAQGTAYGTCINFRTLNAIDYKNAIDLSATGSANCYIVSESGSYKIKAVKGNSSTKVGTCTSTSVLWESFGTSSYISTGSLIALVDYKDNYIYFKTHTTYNEGNAVIAAHDSNDNILWSWHIWMTNDEIQSHVHTNKAGTMMDRNLGATSADPKDMVSYGLLYQWGRKHPFLSGSNRSNATNFTPTMCASTNQHKWITEKSSSSTGTIKYATEHPMTYIMRNTYNYDWYYSTDYTTDNTRWGLTKTIYDPCPTGWKVPKGGKNSDDAGVWGYIPAGNEVFPWNYNGGMGVIIPKSNCGSDAWYPAAGFWDGTKLTRCGHSGRYWACNVWEEKFQSLFISLTFSYNSNGDDDVAMSSQSGVSGAYAQSVRCVKE